MHTRNNDWEAANESGFLSWAGDGPADIGGDREASSDEAIGICDGCRLGSVPKKRTETDGRKRLNAITEQKKYLEIM